MFHDHTIVQRLQVERSRQLTRRTRRPAAAAEDRQDERPDRRPLPLPLPRLRTRTP